MRFALALVSDPAVLILDEPTVGMDVEARRAFWVAVRGFAARGKTVVFATHYLEEADAYADRAVLMAHGRVVADGATSEIRARVGRRTIRATLPDVDRCSIVVAAWGDRGGSPRRRRWSWSARTPTRRSERCSRAIPTARDIEIAGAGLEEAFIELTGEPNDATAASERQGAWYEIARIHALRAGAHVSQLAPAGVLARLPADAVLHDRRAEPPRAQLRQDRESRCPLYYMVGLVSFGAMSALISSGARIASERTDGWTRQLRITPLTHDGVLPRQGPDRVRDGRADDRRCCTRRASHSASRLPAGRWLEMTGLILVALIPFAALGDPARASADRGLDRTGHRRARLPPGARER